MSRNRAAREHTRRRSQQRTPMQPPMRPDRVPNNTSDWRARSSRAEVPSAKPFRLAAGSAHSTTGAHATPAPSAPRTMRCFSLRANTLSPRKPPRNVPATNEASAQKATRSPVPSGKKIPSPAEERSRDVPAPNEVCGADTAASRVLAAAGSAFVVGCRQRC